MGNQTSSSKSSVTTNNANSYPVIDTNTITASTSAHHNIRIIPHGEMGDSDDINAMIERDKCARTYYHLLETCLGENDRDFSKCQKEVALLKKCAKDVVNKRN